MTGRRRAMRAGLLVLTLGFGLMTGAGVHADPVDDYLRLQSLDAIAPSTAGDLVAVSVSRPSEPGDTYRAPISATSAIPLRNDLLVISARDGRVVFRLNGFEDGSSAFSPLWSPDGSRLAFLHLDRSGEVSLRVWSPASGQMQTLVNAGVRPVYPFVRTSSGAAPAAFAWMSSDQIVFTHANDRDPHALDPERAVIRASTGEESVRVWNTGAAPLCRVDDSLSVVALADGAVSQVARGAIMGASVSPDGSAMVIITGLNTLQPPATEPLPAHRAPRSSGAPFVRWAAGAYARDGDGWTAIGPRQTGHGPMLGDSLPRWRADGAQWVYVDVPDPFAHEPMSRVSRVAFGGAPISTLSFQSMREGRANLAAEDAPPPLDARVPETLEDQIGQGASFVGVTGSGVSLFRNRVDSVTTLWAVRNDRATRLLELNGHLRSVNLPTPVQIDYSVDGEPRTGWLFVPQGLDAPPPVVVTAYPLTRAMPAEALPPEGTFPVLPELLTRGVAVYVADLRIQNPGPSIDEPTVRILSEMDANMAALRASGLIDGERAAFFGHSFGGYTALNLIAHTDYFRGIVAAAPLGDLAAYAFSGSSYYDQACGPAEVLSRQMMHEYLGSSDMPPVNNLVMKMGGPPYAMLDKYVRNSPLLDMGRAQTPALIIQGSEDGFLDGERTFNTLYRLGVDAELLWYWGEGHMITGPANVRHMTERSADWIEARLKGPDAHVQDEGGSELRAVP